MKTCLMVIDVQNGFINEETKRVVDRIRTFLATPSVSFDYVVFTKFLNTEGSPFVRFLDWHKLMTVKEQHIHKRLEPYAKLTFQKEGYSALTEEMGAFLWQKQIDKVYLMGVDTECCVLKTALDLFDKGIEPIVLEYYCASTDSEGHMAGIKVLERCMGKNHIWKERLKG